MNPLPDSINRQSARSFSPKLAVCFLVLFFFPALAVANDLVLQDSHGHAVFTVPMQEGDAFAIRYTHSVAQTPVTDHFFIRDNAIWLNRTVYRDFGAGLPHAPEQNQKMRLQDGNLVISGFERRLPDFELRVGRVANHELILFPSLPGEKIIPLHDIASPGQVLKFSVGTSLPKDSQ